TPPTFPNPAVLPLDRDGDGVANLVHIPPFKRATVYSPKLVGGAWTWVGKLGTTDPAQNPDIDLANRNADVRVADVDGDGLSDVVYSSGTEMQTFFALGRYPG